MDADLFFSVSFSLEGGLDFDLNIPSCHHDLKLILSSTSLCTKWHNLTDLISR